MSHNGVRVLVTRAGGAAGALAELLAAEGALPVIAPTIEFEPPDDLAPLDQALRTAAEGGFDWVVFATPRAVEAVQERLKVLGIETPLPTRAAGVGPSTVAAMEQLGQPADLVPDEEYSSAGLIAAFPLGEGSVLLPRADIAPADLEEGLRERGWVTERVVAYQTRHPASLPDEAKRLLDDGAIDAVAFTSASTARGFARLAGRLAKPLYACIGPVTARAAKEAGFKVDAVAEPHTIEGLVEALRGLFADQEDRA